MRIGSSRPIRRPGFIFVALFAAFSLIALAGCDDNSPVAAPTSTLPEQEPDDDATGAGAEVDIPDYETDLDLSAEEEEAVDGALVAFDGYFRAVNEAYSGTYSAAEDFSTYATGDAIESINGDVKVIKDGTYDFSGTVTPTEIEVSDVAKSRSGNPSQVTIHFCFDLSKWSLLPKDEAAPTTESDLVTMQHVVQKKPDGWKVAEQTLKERKC